MVKKKTSVKTGRKKAVARKKAPRPVKKLRARKPAPRAPAPVEKSAIPEKFQSVYAKLMGLRERLTRQINFLAADNLTRSEKDTEVDFRSKEQGTDNFDRDFALNCVSRNQDIIFAIDEALNRIRLGSYGKCDTCGRQIERQRLGALPYSRTCLGCQSQMETGRGGGKPVPETANIYSGLEKSSADEGGEEE